VDSLIGSDTVNTVPPVTLQAFMDHGRVAVTIDKDIEGARARMVELAELEVNFEAITQKLLNDGVAAFAKPFEALMRSIQQKIDRLCPDGDGITKK
jgi:transaldolase